MERNMDLVRLLLLQIEKEYVSTAIINLKVDGYSMEEVGYHCSILEEAGLISSYAPRYASDSLYFFTVGHLTWEGHDFLDKIRDDSMWGKVKTIAKKKGIPLFIDTIKSIANAFISSAVEGATKAIIQGGI